MVERPLGPICIIGMHRSGTSMVARLLRQCGLYLGPDDHLLGPDHANPAGHFEHTGILKINEAILRRFDGSWDFPLSLAAGWEQAPQLEDLRAEARSLVGSFSDQSLWGWKEPRTTILLPFWKSLVPCLRFVVCVRSPLDVAMSLAKRNQMPIDHGAFLWNRYMRSAIEDTEGCPRIFTFYEDFFTDAAGQIEKLLGFCGVGAPTDYSAVADEIQNDLRHQRSETSRLLAETAIPAEYKLLYMGLRALSISQYSSRAPKDESAENVGGLLRLLDEIHGHEQLERMQTALAEKNRELSKLSTGYVETQNRLKETEHEIKALQRQVALLQEHADRLQTFSDAVRQTWVYRVYRRFLRPLRSN